MKLYTEKECLNQIQQFAFKLRNLYLTDREQFEQINDFVPYSIHVNRKSNLDIVYANKQILSRGKELETLVELGASYLPKISCPVLLEKAKIKIKRFDAVNDNDRVCTILQNIQVNQKRTFFHSNKLMLNDSLYFNVSSFNNDLDLVGRVFENVFEPFDLQGQMMWDRFYSLTKREKEILKLLADGYSNKEVGDKLCVSQHCVHAHRRNIYSKLDINKTSQLVRFAIALEII